MINVQGNTVDNRVLFSTREGRYQDFYIFEHQEATVAPNIYLYPETLSNIDVKINVLKNGGIRFSIPDYINGWNISVDPTGKINDSLGFLYYDFNSIVPYQSDSSWVVKMDNFDVEITSLLSKRGFNHQEILDFIDFWKKYLKGNDWVVFCPINGSKMVDLKVTPKPTTVFRELYLVIPSSGEKPIIKEPKMRKPFKRVGFTLVEWGGHLDGLPIKKVINDKMTK